MANPIASLTLTPLFVKSQINLVLHHDLQYRWHEMALSQIAHQAEISGVIVVVVTLIYLSVQIQKGKELLGSESRQAQAENDQNGVFKFVEQPELGNIFSQTETRSFDDAVKLQFWIIGKMRAREHDLLQHGSGRMDEETWMSNRDVIYFLLGAQRARALWEMSAPFFNPDFDEMSCDMIKDLPYIDFWDKLETVG
jgi:hypothetical protein